ncbi:MAG: ATP-binding protein [Bdellovibrionales bacterium]
MKDLDLFEDIEKTIYKLKMKYLERLYFLTASVLLGFTIYFLNDGLVNHTILVFVFFGLTAVFGILVRKNKLGLIFSANLINLLIFSVITLTFFISGGLKAPAIFWLPILYFSTFVLLGKRLMIFWAAISTFVIVLFLIAHHSGIEFTSQIDLANRHDLHFVHYVLLTAYSLSLGFLQSRLQENLLFQKETFLANLHHENRLLTLGELTAGIGHELNNPLTIAILSFKKIKSSMTQNRPANTVDIEKVSESLNRMKKIIKSISRLVRQKNNIIEQFDVNNSINNTLDLYREMYNKLGIELVFIESSKDAYVLGNEQLFTQVITNLIANARDALLGLEKIDKKVSILVDESPRGIYIHVEDNGPGIPKDKQEKIFDSFYTTKEVGLGTGLGLSLSRRFIRDMGGTISVGSQIGVGTKFTICLPAAGSNLTESA